MTILALRTEFGRGHMRGAGRTLALIVAAAALAAAPAVWAQATAAAPATSPLHPVVYTMEQLRTGPITPEIQKQLGPLNTMSEVETLLKANRIPFAWQIGDIASTALPPELAGPIAALKPADVFVVPTPNGALIGTILSQH